MDPSAFFALGHMVKPRGFRGELIARFDTDFPEKYRQLNSLFLEKAGEHIPYRVVHLSFNKGLVYIKLEGIDDEAAAKALSGLPILLPSTYLSPLPPHQFYYHELVGFTIEDQKHGTLGKVAEVYTSGETALIATLQKGKEVLIPLQEPVVQEVDKANKKIITQLPEGLLDVYLVP